MSLQYDRLRFTGVNVVNGAYELQTERQVMLDNVLFIPGIGFDSDALAYIKAVEEADGQTLEREVRNAINQFVRGCKGDGIWDAIKASCILAGARTLDGALVPLKGPAPTNEGPFVSGDYNRKTGLLSNGTTKSLDSNRNNNADPQDSKHLSVFVHTPPTITVAFKGYIGIGGGASGSSVIGQNQLNSNLYSRLNNVTADILTISPQPVGFIGSSRSSSTGYTLRRTQTNVTLTRASQVPFDGTVGVFRETLARSDCRLQWYSIGESLDLSKLEARLTTLINTFGAVI